MHFFSAAHITVAAYSLLFSSFASACNPLTTSGCAADKALGGSVTVDFTKGASSEFTASYDVITYESDGIHLTVQEKGNAPLLVSNWYIMFGRFEIVFQSATGTGMVSSAIMQSDDLDEIDWELLGAYPTEAQTNYYGRGVTETYDREVTVADSGAVTGFHTYAIDWSETVTTWSIDGVVLRTLYAADAEIDSSGKSEYPQSPMQIKIGPWAGGDPDNAAGTISWAGGDINYSGGPYTMIIQSVSVTDYSTGSEYEYAGTDGTYKDITAVGGIVNGNSNGATTGVVSSVTTSTSAIASTTIASSTAASSIATSTVASSSLAYYYSSETESTTSINTRTAYPWVPLSTTASSAGVTTTTAALTVTGSTSSSTTTSTRSPPFSSSSPSSSAAGSAGGDATVTTSSTSSITVVVATGGYKLANSTTAVALSDSVVTSTTSSESAAYTGAADTKAVVQLGVVAFLAAGVVLAI